VYDKSVKGYVYHLSGGPGHKLALPKDASKDRGLGLTQPFVVFQVFVPEGHHASFEIQFSDDKGTWRRLVMSTSFVEVKPSPLHCQVPLPPSALPPERWTALAVHVPSMARALFSDNNASQGAAGFRAVEHVGVGAHCKLRRIFTLRAAPAGDAAFAGGFVDALLDHTSARGSDPIPAVAPVPRAVDFPKDVPHMVSVVVPSRLEGRAGKQASRERGLGSRERARSRGSSRDGASGQRGWPAAFDGFAPLPPGSPHLSRRGSLEVHERWGFAALATSSGDGDETSAPAPEGWQIAFGSRVSTPARGSRPGSRAKESASRERRSNEKEKEKGNSRRADLPDDAAVQDGERDKDALAASIARGLRFDADFSTNKADELLTNGTNTSDVRFGGWDFMRDGVSRQNKRAPGALGSSSPNAAAEKERDRARTKTFARSGSESFRPVGERKSSAVRRASVLLGRFLGRRRRRRRVRRTATRRGRASAERRRIPACGKICARNEWPGTAAARRPSRGVRPAATRPSYRMYTPELVVVSDRASTREEESDEKRENRGEDVGDAGDAGDVLDDAGDDAHPPRVSVSASSDSSTAEKENEGDTAAPGAETRVASGKELTVGAAGPGLDPEKTRLAADQVADLDLVYDPILNFYYDPKNGKYYELV
jgi:hypothetical protein